MLKVKFSGEYPPGTGLKEIEITGSALVYEKDEFILDGEVIGCETHDHGIHSAEIGCCDKVEVTDGAAELLETLNDVKSYFERQGAIGWTYKKVCKALGDPNWDKTKCYCGAVAVWVRSTQFTGKYHFCDRCARQENDFGQEESSYFVWRKLDEK